MDTTSSPKIGRFRRSWELTKSSWRVLKLDKELTLLPIMGALISALVLVAALVLLFGILIVMLFVLSAHRGQNFSLSGTGANIPFIILGILLYIALVMVGNLFSGAIIFGATERFRGGDPTVRSSLAGAWHKFGPLAAFSLMTGTVGLVLQVLENRLPFAGKIAAWIGGASWAIANLFAVPVIVLTEEDVRPLAATKASIGIVRKVWGEGIVMQVGIGFIGLLSFLGYFVLAVAVSIVGTILSVPSVMGALLVIVGIVGLLALLLIFGTLGAIAKAALYHYATTGKAPELFNQELLRSAMTPKKARRIFA